MIIIISGEEGMEHSSKSSMVVMYVVLAITAMALRFVYTVNRKLQPDSNVLRIHVLHIMKRKPRLAQLR